MKKKRNKLLKEQYSKVSDKIEVITLLKLKEDIEEKIREKDPNALVKYELERLQDDDDVVEQKPKTWEEIQAWNVTQGNKTQYYTSLVGRIVSLDINGRTFIHTTKSCVPSERIAKKIRALCQMYTIANFYNDGWKPDYKKNGQIKYFPYWDNYYEKLGIMCSGTGSDTIPAFESKVFLMKAYEHNKEIFETALKP